ncbi:ROK family protein, partial [Anoxynatronum sibiricum]
VRKAIKEEDAELVSIMHDVVEKLGFTLANICVLLDIEQIIIGGRVVDIGYDIKGHLEGMLESTVPVQTKIAYASLNNDEVIYGGFALAVDSLLKDISIYE